MGTTKSLKENSAIFIEIQRFLKIKIKFIYQVKVYEYVRKVYIYINVLCENLEFFQVTVKY